MIDWIANRLRQNPTAPPPEPTMVYGEDRVERIPHGVRFTANHVTPFLQRLPSSTVLNKLDQLYGVGFSAASFAQDRLVAPPGDHSLVSAAHLAYAKHLPLRLSPDVIWLTIAQGFALHVNEDPENRRSEVVRHDGRRRLVLPVRPELPGMWEQSILDWTEPMAEALEGDLGHDMSCDFSTSNESTRIASRVAMMNAFQTHFDYVVDAICGIPIIELTGQPGDWREIRRRVDRLRRFGLAWWTDRLGPVLDQFVAAAEGHPSHDFFRRMVLDRPGCVPDAGIGGWLGLFFPYIGSPQSYVRNPWLDDGPHLRRIGNQEFPPGLAETPVRIATDHGETVAESRVIGGFVGVAQCPITHAVGPRIGWGITGDLSSRRHAGADLWQLAYAS